MRLARALRLACPCTAAPVGVGAWRAERCVSLDAGWFCIFAMDLGFGPAGCTAVGGFGLLLLAWRGWKVLEIGPAIRDRLSHPTTRNRECFSLHAMMLGNVMLVAAPRVSNNRSRVGGGGVALFYRILLR